MSTARIYDQGYRAYDGERRGPSASMVNLAKHTLQRVFGLKRSAWQKVFPVVVLLLSMLPAVVFIGIAALAADRPFEDSLIINPAEYYENFLITALFLFTAFVAPEAVCTDRRNGMLGLYLASPLNRDTYLVSKFAAITGVLAVLTILPSLLMMIAYGLEGTGPDGVDGWLLLLGRVLAAGLLTAAFWAALSLAISSLTSRRALASVSIFLGLLVASVISGALIDGPDWEAAELALIDVFAMTSEAVFRIYGEVDDNESIIQNLETWKVFLTLVGLSACFAAFTRWRYQRLKVTR